MDELEKLKAKLRASPELIPEYISKYQDRKDQLGEIFFYMSDPQTFQEHIAEIFPVISKHIRATIFGLALSDTQSLNKRIDKIISELKQIKGDEQ